ncbi:MAG: PspC domain-containing protein [Anaerolineae bacterium]|nr:PspC domain-containing protein [Anaerolineae bacterium]MCA9887745.1 PspC domain-containing protein [Anaerolineae bacterium]MCA9894805.1 PspC domain-containing protein [Anaerolineae bacterium]MCB9459435.1 PspC domain-containing protein [Anaerolineaceae bacterium]
METSRRLTKSNDRMIAGVCGGVAEYFNVDPTLVRLLFVLFALAGGPGLLVYIVLALVMPNY